MSNGLVTVSFQKITFQYETPCTIISNALATVKLAPTTYESSYLCGKSGGRVLKPHPCKPAIFSKCYRKYLEPSNI